MKRIEMAYTQYPSGLIYGGKGTGVDECRLQNYGCCPYFLGLGEDLDKDTLMEKHDEIIGCRGITCQECWDKEL